MNVRGPPAIYAGHAVVGHQERGHINTPHGHLVYTGKPGRMPISGDVIEFDENFRWIASIRQQLFNNEQPLELFESWAHEEQLNGPEQSELNWEDEELAVELISPVVQPQLEAFGAPASDEGPEALVLAMSKLGTIVSRTALPVSLIKPYFDRDDRIVYLQDNCKSKGSFTKYENTKAQRPLRKL